MFIEARALPDAAIIEANVCIIGAGAAGIAIARELDGTGLSVALLESGGFHQERVAQALNQGTNEDFGALPLDESRFRLFGGTTSRWAGWCRPLDPIDFEPRNWIPSSGWPITRADLDEWYVRANVVCETPWNDDLAVADWPLDRDRVAIAAFRLSPPTHFGRVHRGQLQRSTNVTVYLGATAVRLERRSEGPLSRVNCATLDGRRFAVTARIYVLATGGIENARLLLASSSDSAHAPGNSHDLVGRFYMDHPALFSGVFTPSPRCPPIDRFSTEHVSNPGKSTRVTGAFALPESVLREEQLAGSVTRFVPRPAYTLMRSWDHPAAVSARWLAHSVRNRKVPDRAVDHLRRAARDVPAVLRALADAGGHALGPETRIAMRTWVECVPDASNRVTLSTKQNAFGPLAHLVWRTGSIEKRSLLRLHALLDEELRRLRFGTIEQLMTSESDPWPPSQVGASHHMGTTRMSDSARQGVVDRNCRVHDCPNLFVAGSSVFPTAGYANPTLTIVALALRLADYIKRTAP